jgi:hypothetical protein
MFDRPPALSTRHISIQDLSTHNPEPLLPEAAFDRWKFKFVFECLGPIHAQASATDRPIYASVLELTRQLESYPTWDPPKRVQGDEGYPHANQFMQEHYSRVMIQEVTLYLHRPFFAISRSLDKLEFMN